MLTTVSRTTTVSMTQRRSAAPVRVKQQRQGVRFGRKEQRRAGVVTAGLFGLGLPEIVVIGGVAAVLFGPQKLPELGKSLGKTVKSFQEAAKEFKDELQDEMAEDGAPKAIEENKSEDSN